VVEAWPHLIGAATAFYGAQLIYSGGCRREHGDRLVADDFASVSRGGDAPMGKPLLTGIRSQWAAMPAQADGRRSQVRPVVFFAYADDPRTPIRHAKPATDAASSVGLTTSDGETRGGPNACRYKRAATQNQNAWRTATYSEAAQSVRGRKRLPGDPQPGARTRPIEDDLRRRYQNAGSSHHCQFLVCFATGCRRGRRAAMASFAHAATTAVGVIGSLRIGRSTNPVVATERRARPPWRETDMSSRVAHRHSRRKQTEIGNGVRPGVLVTTPQIVFGRPGFLTR